MPIARSFSQERAVWRSGDIRLAWLRTISRKLVFGGKEFLQVFFVLVKKADWPG